MARFILLAALFAQMPLVAVAQSHPVDRTRSVTLAKVDGRAIAPVCPSLAQIREFGGMRGHWSKATIGCGHVLRGNFDHAELVADSGAYLQVRFARRNVPSTSSWMYQGDTTRTLWTLRSRFVVSAPRK